eukprot:CAMPEP_0174261412 /NCGR_PEP_ID=MMETSP0439-20130205/11416_1 /TAXON_ID=0 /ORGANISM="Stereomyxa ramosa, Strain Chinc5" /LENGTH=468 /DNA_ID=CAMNT_0015345883 /DNA_START=157 /DNA_END=1560 /DNA_ORIENTATION=-
MSKIKSSSITKENLEGEKNMTAAIERRLKEETSSDDCCYFYVNEILERDDTPRDSKNFAYATLLYNEVVLPGALTLGKTIDASNTPYPKVAIVTQSISPRSRKLLSGHGWLLHEARQIANPNANHHNLYQSRFDFVYSKLNMYNLTDYDKVVYLDTDTIVMENIDELFLCPGYCANVRNAFFNTGVIVLKPRASLFNKLVKYRTVLPSYNGGEQGLMNSYLSDFDRACPMFHNDPETINSLYGKRCGRLPAYYNGDIALHFLNKVTWLLPDKRTSPKIIHYTMGVFKPWHFFSYAIFEIYWIWWSAYSTGEQVSYTTIWTPLHFLLPAIPVALAVFWFNSKVIQRFYISLVAKILELYHKLPGQEDGHFGSSIIFLFLVLLWQVGSLLSSACFSLYMASYLPLMHPYFGWILTIEWVLVLNVVSLGNVFYFCYIVGFSMKSLPENAQPVGKIVQHGLLRKTITYGCIW